MPMGARFRLQKISRQHALNDLVARAFASACLPVTKEPHGLTRSDGKRPDGLTLVPWKEGKPLTWDVTAVCPLADLYVEASARDPGSAAEQAARCKADKYSALGRTHVFQLIAVETLDPINLAACSFLSELRRKISAICCEDREISFLFQRMPVLVRLRYNAILLRQSFTEENRPIMTFR